MNWATLNEINCLLDERNRLATVLYTSGKKEARIYKVPNHGQDVLLLSFDWELIEPILKARYEQIEQELKDLGYEED